LELAKYNLILNIMKLTAALLALGAVQAKH